MNCAYWNKSPVSLNPPNLATQVCMLLCPHWGESPRWPSKFQLMKPDVKLPVYQPEVNILKRILNRQSYLQSLVWLSHKIFMSARTEGKLYWTQLLTFSTPLSEEYVVQRQACFQAIKGCDQAVHVKNRVFHCRLIAELSLKMFWDVRDNGESCSTLW